LLSYFLGLSLDRAGKRSDALAAFREAVRLNPKSAEAHLGVGKTQLALGQVNDAIAELQETLHLSPGDIQARRLLSQAFRRAGNTKSATEHADASSDTPPPAEGDLLGDFLPNRIAVARVPNKFQRQPMLCRGSLIAQHIKRPVIRGHDCVQTTIIVDVSNRHATPHPGFSKNATRLRRDVFKAVACVPCQQHWFAVVDVVKCKFDRFPYMSLREE